jgi:hypothetical protein
MTSQGVAFAGVGRVWWSAMNGTGCMCVQRHASVDVIMQQLLKLRILTIMQHELTIVSSPLGFRCSLSCAQWSTSTRLTGHRRPRGVEAKGEKADKHTREWAPLVGNILTDKQQLGVASA